MPLDLQTRPRAPTTLVEDLEPDVASLRANLHAEFGTRPWRVFLITATWSGGEPGRGTQTKTKIELGCGFADDGSITPPRVRFQTAYERARAGTDGRDVVTVSEIMRATSETDALVELDLVTLGRLAPGEETFFEIQQDGRGGGVPDLPLRRYTLDGSPTLDAIAMSWTLSLREQNPDGEFGQTAEVP